MEAKMKMVELTEEEMMKVEGGMRGGCIGTTKGGPCEIERYRDYIDRTPEPRTPEARYSRPMRS